MPVRAPDALAWLVDQGERRVLGRLRDAHVELGERLLAPVPPLRRAHTDVAAASYAAARAMRVTASGLRALADHGVGPRLDSRAAGLLAVADVLDPTTPVGPGLVLRLAGHDLEPQADVLRAALPHATGHVVVLVHGLLEHDGSWQPPAGPSYADALRARTAATPVTVRYATGRAPGETGRELARTLETLLDAWPAAVTRVSLVGHGMGGRVVLAASRHALAAAQDWPALVRDVVLLGEPESGAPGEKLAHLARPLRPAPVRALGAGRSPLLVGAVAPDGWLRPDVTVVWGADRRAVAPLPRAVHRVVRRPGRPLLHDPQVADLLVGWLGARPAPMLGDGPHPTEGDADGRA